MNTIKTHSTDTSKEGLHTQVDKHGYITLPYMRYELMKDALELFFELDSDPQIHGAMPVFLRSFRDKAKEALKDAPITNERQRLLDNNTKLIEAAEKFFKSYGKGWEAHVNATDKLKDAIANAKNL